MNFTIHLLVRKGKNDTVCGTTTVPTPREAKTLYLCEDCRLKAIRG